MYQQVVGRSGRRFASIANGSRWSLSNVRAYAVVRFDRLDPVNPRKVANSCSVQPFEPLTQLAEQPTSRLPGVIRLPVVIMHVSTSQREQVGIALDQGWGICRTGLGFGLKDLLIQRRQALPS